MRRAKQHTQHVETLRATSPTIHATSPTIRTYEDVGTQRVACYTIHATTRDVARYVSTDGKTYSNQHALPPCLCGLDPQSHTAPTQRNTLRPYFFGRARGGWLFQALCCLLLLFMAACQQETLEGIGGGEGTLLLDGLRKQTTADSLSTKAVDDDLYVEIWQVGERRYQYTPGETPNQLKLDEGAYLLKSYNAAALSTEVSGKGEAIFQLEKNFNITDGEINRLDAIVPMTNVGIRLAKELPQQFTGYQLTVQQGTRSVTLSQNEVAYFTAGEQLLYTLSATNADGELRTQAATMPNPVAGTIYEINYSFATQGDILYEP